MRGSDIAYFPLFFAYAIIDTDKASNPKLYLREKNNRISGIMTHLNTGSDGTCSSSSGDCVQVKFQEKDLTITSHN